MTARLDRATNALAAHASVEAFLHPPKDVRLRELVAEYDAALKEACDRHVGLRQPTGYTAPVIPSDLPIDYALTEHAVAAMDRIEDGVSR